MAVSPQLQQHKQTSADLRRPWQHSSEADDCATSFLQPILVHRQQIRASSPSELPGSAMHICCTVCKPFCSASPSVGSLLGRVFECITSCRCCATPDVCCGVVTGNVQEVKPVSIQPRVVL